MSEDATPSDELLLSRVRDGSREALASLYDRHAPTLLGLASRILESPRDAEDLVHDVFVEAWQRSGSYDADRGTVRAWLAMRLRSRGVDRLRALARARARGLAAEPDLAAQACPRPGPEGQADRARVRRALAGLTERQRQVVELGYFQGLTCREMAERLGVPHGTVKSRLATAMASLRKGLGTEGAR